MLIEGDGLNKQERSEWIVRGRGPAMAIFLGDIPRGNDASETIDI